MGQGFIIVVIILVVIGGIALAIYLEHQRRQFWRDLAAAWGFQYSTNDLHSIRDGYPFQFLKQGHSRKVYNVIEGKEKNRALLLFDFTYKTGSGKNQQTHNTSALIVHLPIMGMRLNVRPENVLDRFVAFFGFEDINFEMEEFNRAFQVNCDNKKFAYDIFHPQMMEYLLQHRNMAFEWHGDAMIVTFYQRGRFNRESAEQIKAFTHGFIDRIPQYLTHLQIGE